MNEYEFTLKFSFTDKDFNEELILEKLYNSGCDDALIGLGKKGRIAFDFIREANSANEAVFSAIKDIKQALPSARLIEATPDFVSLT